MRGVLCAAALMAWVTLACGGAGEGATAGEDLPLATDVAAEDTTPPPPAYPYCTVDEAEVTARWDALTPRQRIGQLVLVGVFPKAGELDADATALLTEYGVGGVFMGPPAGIVLDDPAATARSVHAIKALAYGATGVPIFMTIDQEGGPNTSINGVTGGTDTCGNMPLGAVADPAVVYEQFDIMAREIRALGFNMDFGPVLDTLVSTRNGNLNTRSFGPDAQTNAALGAAAVEALQMNGILAVGKHFPGDGLSDGNTHKEHIVVDADWATLDATSLPPFRAAIARGLDGMMTIPAAYAALDPERSAITSHAVTTVLLRQELGFEGLVLTDALGMAGATIGLAEDALPGLEALKAGADILVYVNYTVAEAETLYTRIEAALASGELDPAEFEARVRRVLAMKQRYCLFDDPVAPDEAAIATLDERIRRPEDLALSRSHADQAPVLLEDDGILPLTGKQVLYVGPDTIFSDPGSGWINILDQTFGDALAAHDPTVEQVTYFLPPAPSQVFAQVMDHIEAADVVVMGTLQGRFSLGQQQLLEWIITASPKPLVHVILGVPFDYAQSRGRVAAALALMGSRSVMVEAGAAVLYGLQDAPGTMAFDLDAVDPDGVDGEPGEPGTGPDLCMELEIDCSGGGMCVDTGTDVGCVCHPNWHPAPDGLDCLPDR